MAVQGSRDDLNGQLLNRHLDTIAEVDCDDLKRPRPLRPPT